MDLYNDIMSLKPATHLYYYVFKEDDHFTTENTPIFSMHWSESEKTHQGLFFKSADTTIYFIDYRFADDFLVKYAIYKVIAINDKITFIVIRGGKAKFADILERSIPYAKIKIK